MIAHAQLITDGPVVMLTSGLLTSLIRAALMLTIAEADRNTQASMCCSIDVDRTPATARAGTDIIMKPEARSYNGHSYSARDPKKSS